MTVICRRLVRTAWLLLGIAAVSAILGMLLAIGAIEAATARSGILSSLGIAAALWSLPGVPAKSFPPGSGTCRAPCTVGSVNRAATCSGRPRRREGGNRAGRPFD